MRIFWAVRTNCLEFALEKAKTNNVCLNVILVMCFFYVNTIPHRLVVHVYFYVYLNVVHEGFESVILLVLQIILVRLNSISSAFVVSRCKGSSYFTTGEDG